MANKLCSTTVSARVPSSQKSSIFCSLLRVSVTVVVSPVLKKPTLPQCQMCLHVTTSVALILGFLYIWLKNGRMESWGVGYSCVPYHNTQWLQQLGYVPDFHTAFERLLHILLSCHLCWIWGTRKSGVRQINSCAFYLVGHHLCFW